MKPEAARRGAGLLAALSGGTAVLLHPSGLLPLLLPTLYATRVSQLVFSAIAGCALLVAIAFLLVRNRPAAFVNLGVSLFAFLMCGLIVELALRQIDLAAARELPLYQESGDSSFVLKPNLDLAVQFADQEVRIRTNRHGMRWRDVVVDRPEGVERIAVVGDSFTFGLWADDVSSSFVSIFESNLDTPRTEVLNFGAPGYGLADVHAQLVGSALAFDPSHVVLAVYTGNDLLDTYLGERRYRVRNSGVLELNADRVAELVPPEFRTRYEGRGVVESLAVVRLASIAVNQLFPDFGEQVRTSDRESNASDAEDDYASNLFWSRVDYPPFAVAAKDATLSKLEEIRLLLERRGVSLTIVAIPSIDQVEWSAPENDRIDVRYPQMHVEEYAAMHGVPYLDLLPLLRAHVDATSATLYYPSDGHFNDAGHRLTGALLADFFEQAAGPLDEGGSGSPQ